VRREGRLGGWGWGWDGWMEKKGVKMFLQIMDAMHCTATDGLEK
jgi:hypothetical protein